MFGFIQDVKKLQSKQAVVSKLRVARYETAHANVNRTSVHISAFA